MAGGNGGAEVRCQECGLSIEVSEHNQRLHLVERDVCSHALEAAVEARQTRARVDVMAQELTRFENALVEALDSLRAEVREAAKKAKPRKRLFGGLM